MKPFDPVMVDRHPAVQVVVGRTQSGKSTYLNLCLALWRARGGLSLAIDGVCKDPPEQRHIARWASTWAEEPPDAIPPEISLLVCDEAARFLSPGHTRHEAFREAIFRGQHTGKWGLSTILATQRAKQIGVDAWSQAQRIVCFRTQDARDLERIAELPGLTQAHIELIPHLPPGYAVVWDDRDGVFVPWIPEWQAAS